MNAQNPYRRRQSRPATLLTHIKPASQHDQEEREFSESSFEEEQELSDDQQWRTNHLTSRGTPDRRYIENRGLTKEDVGIVESRRNVTERVVNGIHVTEEGTPDRRFKENRALTDDDIEILKAELILQKHGINRNEVTPTAILARHASSEAITQPQMQSPVKRASGVQQKQGHQTSRGQKTTGTGGRR